MYLWPAGVGEEKTALSSTVMMSISVQVMGPVWEPICVGVHLVGTVAHVRSRTVDDTQIVSRVFRKRDVDGVTRA